MKPYFLGTMMILTLGMLAGCAPMQASVPPQTAAIGGMQSTPMNPIEGYKPTPMENANRMISY